MLLPAGWLPWDSVHLVLEQVGLRFASCVVLGATVPFLLSASSLRLVWEVQWKL